MYDRKNDRKQIIADSGVSDQFVRNINRSFVYAWCVMQIKVIYNQKKTEFVAGFVRIYLD